MDNQLPAEVLDCIDNWVVTFALAYHKSSNKDIANDSAEYIADELSKPNALTEYATKLHTARTLLEKVASRHDAGLLPDRFIYQEIKNFLDGK